MEMQDHIEGIKLNSSGNASNNHYNDGTKSGNVDLLNDQTPNGNSHPPKVRKPYTISKQREKWTEEEHQKFLEALKLYGRGWRQIEEHIGTKTAVQIRSHAQKFFSKVARESDGASESPIKPSDIPPPRPKRKPLHPYPRKSVDSGKRLSIANEAQRSQSPNLAVAEKDTQSPTSVLSASNSEVFGSASPEQPNTCQSPNSCATDVHSSNLSTSPVEKENDCMTFDSSVEEEKGSLASLSLSAGLNLNVLSTKSELSSKDTESSIEDATNVAHITSIKLFGRTIQMVDNQKLLDVDGENIKAIASKSDHVDDVENEKLGQSWAIQPTRLTTITRMTEKETSCTGSNAGTGCEMDNGDRNSDADDSQSQLSHREGENVPRREPSRGFVPYKRCLAERDANSAFVALEGTKGQRARVCL